jgi:drug/metabolite transporter (DMT)-like permease
MRDIIRHRGGVAPLIAASIAFALWNTAYKYAVDGLPAITALCVMLLVAAVALWAFAAVKGPQRLTLRQLGRIALAGVIDPAASYAAIGVGLSHIAATVSALLYGTEACFTVAFGALIARRAPRSRVVMGVLLSAAGVAVLGGTRSLLGMSPWELLVLGGVACAGLCNVLSERILSDDVAPLTMTAYQMSFAALCALPLLAWQWRSASGGVAGPAQHPAASAGPAWAAAVACGIALATAYLLYNYAIARVPVATAGMVLNTLPVFGVAAAIAFLGERITWAQVAGAAVILAAFFLFAEGEEEAGAQAEDTPVPQSAPQAQPAPVPSPVLPGA